MSENQARKNIVWMGSTKEDLRGFPDSVRRDLGYQIDAVQRGEDPVNWRPVAEIGPGTREIRVSGDGGWYRVLYVVKWGETVHILHVFQKKTNATTTKEKNVAKARYAEADPKSRKK